MPSLAARVLAVVVALALPLVAVVGWISVARLWTTIFGEALSLMPMSWLTPIDRAVRAGRIASLLAWPAGSLALAAIAPEKWSRWRPLRVLAGVALVLFGTSAVAVGALELLVKAPQDYELSFLPGQYPLADAAWWVVVSAGLLDLVVGAGQMSVGAALFSWRPLVAEGRGLLRLGLVAAGGIFGLGAGLAALGVVLAHQRFAVTAWGLSFVWMPDEIGFYLTVGTVVLGLWALWAAVVGRLLTAEPDYLPDTQPSATRS